MILSQAFWNTLMYLVSGWLFIYKLKNSMAFSLRTEFYMNIKPSFRCSD